MPNLRSKIRFWAGIILAAIVIPIIVGVVGEFFIEYAREQGAYDNPSQKADSVMGALNALVTQTWFLLLAAFVGGLTAGLWLDVVLRKGEKQERLHKKEDRVSEESRKEEHRREAQLAIDDLKSEGVRYRNELLPIIEKYDDNAQRGRLKDWSDRVLAKLDEAGVGVGARSRFRTLNLFEPNYHVVAGKDVRQLELESIWNEKLDRLQEIIDKFD